MKTYYSIPIATAFACLLAISFPGTTGHADEPAVVSVDRDQIIELLSSSIELADAALSSNSRDREILIQSIDLASIGESILPENITFRTEAARDEILNRIRLHLDYPDREYAELLAKKEMFDLILFSTLSKRLPQLTDEEVQALRDQADSLAKQARAILIDEIGGVVPEVFIKEEIELFRATLVRDITSNMTFAMKVPLSDVEIDNILWDFQGRIEATKNRIPDRLAARAAIGPSNVSDRYLYTEFQTIVREAMHPLRATVASRTASEEYSPRVRDEIVPQLAGVLAELRGWRDRIVMEEYSGLE